MFALALSAIFAVYIPSLANGFVWIDESEILEHRLIVDNATELTSLLWSDENHRSYYRPVNNLLHTANYYIWGAWAGGYHLASLVLHLVNALLLGLLLLRMKLGEGPSALAMLLWATHPVNAEAVGLITAIQTVAVVSFLLLAMHASYHAIVTPSPGALVLAASAYAIASLTKEVAFVVPVVALGTAIIYRDQLEPDQRLRAVRVLAVVLLVTAAVVVWRLLVVRPFSITSVYSLKSRLATFMLVYLDYWSVLVLPLRLRLSDTVTDFMVLDRSRQLLGVVSFTALGIIQLWVARRSRFAMALLLALNLLLLPVSQIVPILHFRADRYLYAPSMALAVLVAIHVRHGWGGGWNGRRAALAIVVLSALAWNVVLTQRRLAQFRDDATLFAHEVALVPDYREGLCMLARVNERTGNTAAAERLYDRCLAQSPGRISYANIGTAVLNYSHILINQDRPREALAIIEKYEASVEDAWARSELEYNAGIALFLAGEYSAAMPRLGTYCGAHPSDASCRYFLGMSALHAGDHHFAVQSLQLYLQLHPMATDRLEVEAILADLEMPAGTDTDP